MEYKPRRIVIGRKTKGQRYNEIMEYLFYCNQRGWKPSGHDVAIELKLRPSHYVRGLLQGLADCGIIQKENSPLPNGRVAHRWSLDLAHISKVHPDWRAYLLEKFGVWPIELL